MDTTITINMETTDKQLVEDRAKDFRLSTSAYCRYVILKNLKQEDFKQI
jgi:hypothetical protein